MPAPGMWHERCRNAQAIATLYESVEGLDRVELFEATLKRDTGSMELRVQLARYPDHPPAKWDAQSNAVQVRLEFFGVGDLRIEGFGRDNVGRLIVEGAERGLLLRFDAPSMRLTARCDVAQVNGISAYIDDRVHLAGEASP